MLGLLKNLHVFNTFFILFCNRPAGTRSQSFHFLLKEFRAIVTCSRKISSEYRKHLLISVLRKHRFIPMAVQIYNNVPIVGKSVYSYVGIIMIGKIEYQRNVRSSEIITKRRVLRESSIIVTKSIIRQSCVIYRIDE